MIQLGVLRNRFASSTASCGAEQRAQSNRIAGMTGDDSIAQSDVEEQPPRAGKRRLDPAGHTEVVLRVLRIGEIVAIRFHHAAMTTFRAPVSAACEKVS